MANLKTTLLDLELKRTELLERYDPSYPLVQEVETKISGLLLPSRGRATRHPGRNNGSGPCACLGQNRDRESQGGLDRFPGARSAMAGALKTLENKAHRLAGESVFQQDLLRTAKATRKLPFFITGAREARIADALDQGKIINAAVAEAPVAPLVPAVCRRASNCSWPW